jgi:hypothetical protein
MPVPKEVVGWLDEEEEALAHHNLLILNYKIFGRLQQQNTGAVKCASSILPRNTVGTLSHAGLIPARLSPQRSLINCPVSSPHRAWNAFHWRIEWKPIA